MKVSVIVNNRIFITLEVGNTGYESVYTDTKFSSALRRNI